MIIVRYLADFLNEWVENENGLRYAILTIWGIGTLLSQIYLIAAAKHVKYDLKITEKKRVTIQ